MSDTPIIETPVVESASEFTPISASADGKRNTYSRRCDVVEQVMNYAACLWRQNVLAAPNVKTPSDWACCAAAARNGTCNALNMRREEEIAGKAIYFRDRQQPSFVDAARKWAHSSWGTVKKAVIPVASPPKPAAVLDKLGSLGDYSDAISEAVSTAPADAPVAAPVPKLTPTQTPVALPGESPLAMARRLHAEKLAGA
jgi:hypothetical protein